jgi:hypothetical protein
MLTARRARRFAMAHNDHVRVVAGPPEASPHRGKRPDRPRSRPTGADVNRAAHTQPAREGRLDRRAAVTYVFWGQVANR